MAWQSGQGPQAWALTMEGTYEMNHSHADAVPIMVYGSLGVPGSLLLVVPREGETFRSIALQWCRRCEVASRWVAHVALMELL